MFRILKGYFIQYKFILPETVKHTSYTYQKLFRALYGYTQAVNKSTGKNYKYHRKGVLSNMPYFRPGKNCVIIPEGSLQPLTSFFKTGKNPTHVWHVKGEWKAVYYMNEKKVELKEAVSALEGLVERTYTDTTKAKKRLSEELERAAKNEVDESYKSHLLSQAREICTHPWFSECHTASKKLSNFKANYDSLKKLTN